MKLWEIVALIAAMLGLVALVHMLDGVLGYPAQTWDAAVCLIMVLCMAVYRLVFGWRP